MTNLARPVPRSTAAAERIRVLIVDDSLVIRHLIREALGGDPAIEIVGAESNGSAALARIPELRPDVVTLDIEMPIMDGLETLRHIRTRHPKLRTIMFSTMTSRGASVTLEALALGADDYVTKAANAGSLDKSLVSLRSELIPKIKQFFALRPEAAKPPVAVPMVVPARLPYPPNAKPQIVAIGVSTGGPQALSVVIPEVAGQFSAAGGDRAAHASHVHQIVGGASQYGQFAECQRSGGWDGTSAGPGDCRSRRLSFSPAAPGRHGQRNARSGSAREFMPAFGGCAVSFRGGGLRFNCAGSDVNRDGFGWSAGRSRTQKRRRYEPGSG